MMQKSTYFPPASRKESVLFSFSSWWVVFHQPLYKPEVSKAKCLNSISVTGDGEKCKLRRWKFKIQILKRAERGIEQMELWELQCTPISFQKSDQLPHFAMEFAAFLRKSHVCGSFLTLDFSTQRSRVSVTRLKKKVSKPFMGRWMSILKSVSERKHWDVSVGKPWDWMGAYAIINLKNDKIAFRG